MTKWRWIFFIQINLTALFWYLILCFLCFVFDWKFISFYIYTSTSTVLIWLKLRRIYLFKQILVWTKGCGLKSQSTFICKPNKLEHIYPDISGNWMADNIFKILKDSKSFNKIRSVSKNKTFTHRVVFPHTWETLKGFPFVFFSFKIKFEFSSMLCT